MNDDLVPGVLRHDVTGDGPVVLLVPGGLTGRPSWEPLVPAFAEAHRVLSVDLWNNAYGADGQIGSPGYTAALDRESLLLTLDHIGADRPVDIVAWSNGARASLDFALHHPDRVASITAVEPAAWWLAGEEREDVRAFTEFFAGVACTDLSEDDLVRFLVDVGVGPAGTPWRDLPTWSAWYSCRNALSWFPEDAQATIREGIRDLASLDVPLLVFKGSNGAAHFGDAAIAIAESVAGARAQTLAGGHACHLQDARTFLAGTLAHLTG